jgi:SAM-dependent methyltransferase
MITLFLSQGDFCATANARYIDWALRKNSKYQFRVMDGTRLNFDDGYFDFVFIGGVIHHLGDDLALAMLREAKRILRPQDGVFLIWEDIPTRSQFNWIGKWVHRLDEGDHIRQEDHYLRLVGSVFKPLKHYLMRSGVCDYSVMVFRNDFNSGSV